MAEDNKNNTLTWWEKTVEYAFVVKNSKGLAIAPLDGRLEESFSDTVIKNGGKFYLIEFKRDKKSLNSEKKKFINSENYEDAKEKLKSDSENCHYLIYGQNSKDDFLKAQGYFSGKKIDEIEDLLTKGIPYNKFNEYLNSLKTYKGSGDNGTGGSGNSLSSVAYVCNIKDEYGKQQVIILSKSEMLKLDQKPAPVQTQTQTQTQ